MNSHPQLRNLLGERWLISKIVGWLRRYLPAEVAGTTAALVGVMLALRLEQPLATVAVVGVWSEVIGFYSAMVLQEWFAEQRRCRQSSANPIPLCTCCKNGLAIFRTFWTSVRQTISFLCRLLRNLVLEFGVAELLDPLILRPAVLILAMQVIPSLSVALIVGKLTADLVFYTVTICSLELRKKVLIA